MFWNLKLEMDGLLMESDLHKTAAAARESLIAFAVMWIRANCTEDERTRMEWISNADLKKDSSFGCETSEEHNQRLETVLGQAADGVIAVLVDHWGVTSIRNSVHTYNETDQSESTERARSIINGSGLRS
ncbi:hypothetical protein [Synechococcus sp. UW179A]|uniref:hypothetical protein n=1 Tax=Synechococcus sp. UW179A TaxID=2575510 RepID=UPI000E0EB177|nr:hypothetical protein [Synechococcus sp. UW179A]